MDFIVWNKLMMMIASLQETHILLNNLQYISIKYLMMQLVKHYHDHLFTPNILAQFHTYIQEPLNKDNK